MDTHYSDNYFLMGERMKAFIYNIQIAVPTVTDGTELLRALIRVLIRSNQWLTLALYQLIFYIM